MDGANASKLGLENWAKSSKGEVALLHCQVLDLQAPAERAWATLTRVAELEVELQETVAQGGEMFIQGQDSVRKELVKWFPSEDFSWINDIFPEEEDAIENMEGRVEGTPNDWISTDNIMDVENTDVMETRVGNLRISLLCNPFVF